MKPRILLYLTVLLVAGCSSHKPILYQNEHYRQVGADAAKADIKACMDLAEEAGASPSKGRTAETATNTVVGGAVGSAAGGGRRSGFRKRRIGSNGRSGQRRIRRVAARPVHQFRSERSVHPVCRSLLARPGV